MEIFRARRHAFLVLADCKKICRRDSFSTHRKHLKLLPTQEWSRTDIIPPHSCLNGNPPDKDPLTRIRSTPVDSGRLRRTPVDSGGVCQIPENSGRLRRTPVEIRTPVDSAGLRWRSVGSVEQGFSTVTFKLVRFQNSTNFEDFA